MWAPVAITGLEVTVVLLMEEQVVVPIRGVDVLVVEEAQIYAPIRAVLRVDLL